MSSIASEHWPALLLATESPFYSSLVWQTLALCQSSGLLSSGAGGQYWKGKGSCTFCLSPLSERITSSQVWKYHIYFPPTFSLAVRSTKGMPFPPLGTHSLSFFCPGKYASSPDALGVPQTHQEVSAATGPHSRRCSLKSGTSGNLDVQLLWSLSSSTVQMGGFLLLQSRQDFPDSALSSSFLRCCQPPPPLQSFSKMATRE